MDAKSGQRSKVCRFGLVRVADALIECTAALLYHLICMAKSHDKHPTPHFFADRWYRFNRYEIKGDYIRPAAGAELISYEPWKIFRSPEGKEGIKQPYEPLLQLARNIDLDYDTVRLLEGGEDRILEWCAQHGALGLLLHQVETVILSPEERIVPFSRRPRLMSTKYSRTNSGWSTERVLPAPFSAERPGVYLRRELAGFGLKFEVLSKTWGSYFPDVPRDEQDKFQYPMPFTPEFWWRYAEPVINFFAAAKKFLEAVDILTGLRSKRRLSEDQVSTGLQSIDVINGLALPVRTMLYRGEKGYEMGWACHSLLAAYSMMVIQDFSSARLLECANPTCRRFFVTKSAEAKYCSPTCRGTVQIRKYRRKKKRASTPSRKDDIRE